MSKALCVKAGYISIESIFEDKIINIDKHPILLHRYSKQLFSRSYLENALKSYDCLASKKMMDTSTIVEWLTLSSSIPQGRQGLEKRASYALDLIPDSLSLQGIASSYALISNWIDGDYKSAYYLVNKHHLFMHMHRNELIKVPQVFFIYIVSLFRFWQYNSAVFERAIEPHFCKVLGESHSLPLSNVNFSLAGNRYVGQVQFIMGIKMYHLSNPSISYHAAAAQEYIEKIDTYSSETWIFTIGEIDTRPDEGIWKNSFHKGRDYKEVVNECVDGYISFLEKELREKRLERIVVQGVPAPCYSFEGDKDPGDKEQFLSMISYTNERMKNKSNEAGFCFLDVYSATVGADRKSNKKWHLDDYHLSPLFYTQLDSWLIES